MEEIIIKDPDDKYSLETLAINIDENIAREKNKVVNEIDYLGENLLKDIESKNKKKEVLKKGLIKKIIRKDKSQSHEDLIDYSYEDISKIYNDLETSKPSLKTIFKFMFNI